MTAAVVIPNWNGTRWLEDCLAAVAAQTEAPGQTIVVDNGSTDGSRELLAERHPEVQVVALERNEGFAAAANRGVAETEADAVALLNTDVVVDPDWLERMCGALGSDPRVGAVAGKMVRLDDPGRIDDAGDVLRRDGACLQLGHDRLDDGRFDAPGECFAACAGAALYRRRALVEVGGFDERFFLYLEDVDLGLRLQLAGWTCRYEPVIARHARRGSSTGDGAVARWVARNTILLVAKAFPLRWAPLVLYRQAATARRAWREGTGGAHARGLAAGLALVPSLLRERRRLRRGARVPVADAVPAMPVRGPRALGHPLHER